MEEYEVDLRDYLRVIWERKWIILGVFVAAVAAAAVYSYSLPDEYRVEALLQYDGRAPFAEISLDLPSSQTIIELMETTPPPNTDLDAQTLGDSGFLSVRLRGSSSPQRLSALLQGQIQDLQEFITRQLNAEIRQETTALEQREELLNERRARLVEELQRWNEQREESLRRQRAEITRQIQALLTNESESQGDSFSRQASLLALTSQLQLIGTELIRLETESSSPVPQAGSALDQQLAEIDRSLWDLELAQSRYHWVLSTSWTPIQVVRAPQASDAPVGPPRRLNVAIAGVLGLFVGLLLAFFVHYLQSEPPTAPEQETRQAETAS